MVIRFDAPLLFFRKEIMMPLTVPQKQHQAYQERFELLTHGTNRLLFFTCDHEHLNTSLDMPEVANNPAHFFTIASKAPIGAFGAPLGLIARYAGAHANIPLVVSLTGDTGMGNAAACSHQLYTVADVAALAASSSLKIGGVHSAVYLGGAHEGAMLHTAAQMVLEAHAHGLVAIISMRADAAHVSHPQSSHTLSRAASAATSLGADFVILSPEDNDNPGDQAHVLRAAVLAAGTTGVLSSGGASMSQDQFITQVNAQLSIAGTRGIAVCRNICQRSVEQGVALCESLSSLIYGKK